ncbi:MAG: glycosyltransferase family 39 protein [Deltaproteobacteria bacterium]|nr:glycosyltransferase family 39 protein [Deltaproteobacteria bacterium]
MAGGALVLVAVVALAFFVDLGRPAFWDPGESRYAETVREMRATGNWIAPTLAFARYYDKPPPYFWVLAGSFAAFGRTEWAARLPSAAAAVATIALTVAFAWSRVGPRAALGAGVVLATTAQVVALGRSVRMDMLLTFLTSVTLLQSFRLLGADARPASRPYPSATWPLYAATALGILVKGPVGLLLPLLVVGAFVLVTRPPLRLARFRPGAASIVAIVGLVAWYVVQAVYVPDYLWTFLWQHNLGRFVGRALAGHAEPIWFYAWILPVTFLPWTLFLPGAVRRALVCARRGDRLAAFLLLWCALPFVFFSLSRAKLATYLLPIAPALALIIAIYLDRVRRAPAATRARALAAPALVWSAALAIVAVGAPIGTALTHPSYARAALAALPLAVFGAAGWQVRRHAAWRAVPALIAAGMLTLQVLFFRVGAPIVDDFASLREAARAADALPADALVFAYKTRGHSFTYYGGRRLLRVRSPIDVARALGRGAPTAALVKVRHLEAIGAHLTRPAYVWWRSPSGRALLANVPTPDGSGVPLAVPDAPAADDTPQRSGAGPGAEGAL